MGRQLCIGNDTNTNNDCVSGIFVTTLALNRGYFFVAGDGEGLLIGDNFNTFFSMYTAIKFGDFRGSALPLKSPNFMAVYILKKVLKLSPMSRPSPSPATKK